MDGTMQRRLAQAGHAIRLLERALNRPIGWTFRVSDRRFEIKVEVQTLEDGVAFVAWFPEGCLPSGTWTTELVYEDVVWAIREITLDSEDAFDLEWRMIVGDPERV